MGSYDRCIPVILRWEGGKVDDKRDPGGRTNQGIIQRVYDAYRKRKGAQPRDVYEMASVERDEIYRTSYWDLIRGDDLPTGVDLVVFDGAVNSGVSQSVKWLQRSLGVVADGVIGPNTIKAAQIADPKALVVKLIGIREAFLHNLRTFSTFGKGWLNRTADIERVALGWLAVGAAPIPHPAPITTPVIDPQGAPKAVVEDMKDTPRAPGDAAAGAGVGTATLGGVVQQLQDQLTPFSMAGGWIGKLVVGLIIVGGLLTLGGLAWRFYAEWKNKQRKATA